MCKWKWFGPWISAVRMCYWLPLWCAISTHTRHWRSRNRTNTRVCNAFVAVIKLVGCRLDRPRRRYSTLDGNIIVYTRTAGDFLGGARTRWITGFGIRRKTRWTTRELNSILARGNRGIGDWELLTAPTKKGVANAIKLSNMLLDWNEPATTIHNHKNKPNVILRCIWKTLINYWWCGGSYYVCICVYVPPPDALKDGCQGIGLLPCLCTIYFGRRS